MQTILITYTKYNSSGHALVDDYETEHSEIIKVEKLTDLNKKYDKIKTIQFLYDEDFLDVFEQMLNCLEQANFYQIKPKLIITKAKNILMNAKRSYLL